MRAPRAESSTPCWVTFEEGVVDEHDAFGSARFGGLEPHGTEPLLRVHVEVHDVRVYERVLRQGSVGLGESYADGWWDADDLAGFLRMALRGLRSTHARRDRVHELASPIIDPISSVRRSDRRRDAKHVRAHYDVGNEFFRSVLDETMAYSCAIFETPEMTLAEASTAKFDRLARILDLSPGDRLVEIGTGWGGFAMHAAERYGCHVTTTKSRGASTSSRAHACTRPVSTTASQCSTATTGRCAERSTKRSRSR